MCGEQSRWPVKRGENGEAHGQRVAISYSTKGQAASKRAGKAASLWRLLCGREKRRRSSSQFLKVKSRSSHLPVKRHRGEPGHTRDTRDTRAHTDHTDKPHNHPNPPTHGRRSRPAQGRPMAPTGIRIEVRLCDPCARVRPCVPCVCAPCVPAPPVSFYLRHRERVI